MRLLLAAAAAADHGFLIGKLSCLWSEIFSNRICCILRALVIFLFLLYKRKRMKSVESKLRIAPQMEYIRMGRGTASNSLEYVV